MSDRANTPERATRADEQRLAVGQLIADKYRIDRILGVGGMGIVVAATHVQLGEVYALKFLRGAGDSDMVERFLREARATVRIKSEHIVRVSDVSQLQSGEPYIVMEYLSGADLGQLLQERGPLPVREAVDYIVQACAGIGEAHANGIVHRDLKPSNLFLTWRPDGSPLVKVLDFGISKIAVEAGPSMTQTHEVFGSPAYMPPEQIRSAKNVDARSDIWALGVILHELLTGALPFEGTTSAALLAAISADRPKSARTSRPDVGDALDAILRRCLEKSPAARFSSVAELAIALAPFASAESAALAQRLIRRASIVPPASTDLHGSAPGPVSISAFVPTERRRAPTPPLLIVACAAALGVGVFAFGSALYLRTLKQRATTVDSVTTSSTETTTAAATIVTPSTTKAEPSAAPPPPSAPSTAASSARKRPRPPSAIECDPPYTIDSEGIRRPKAKCLSP